MKESRIIRNALLYASNFRKKTVVIKIDSNVCEQITKNGLAKDIIMIAKITGMKIYLVITKLMSNVIDEMKLLPDFPQPIADESEDREYDIITMTNNDNDSLADKQACTIAKQFSADKLIFITTGNGIYSPNEQLIHQMDLVQAKKMINNPEISGSIKNKLIYSLEACDLGVTRVHFISGNRHKEDSLLMELFSTEGVGTMISANIYEVCRKANLEDIDEIIEIINSSNFNISTNVKKIADEIDEFYIYSVDDDIHGVIKISMKKESIAEIQFMVAQEKSENHDALIVMLEKAVSESRKNGKTKLTLDIQKYPTWIILDPIFMELGFKKIENTTTQVLDL